MALEEYQRKRDFKKTPEPAPGTIRARQQKLSYLIQKHDATRLHYDFRLELDGVLLSWAVTKGPSLNPADKRLAVRTEDHPLSYGSFEGTIPKGEYGGGTVMLWDNGTWEPKDDPHTGLKKGHLSFILHGNRLKGAWDLVRMHGEAKRENWLLIKKPDEEARREGNILEEAASSVSSGRSLSEIAEGVDPKRKKKASSSNATLKKLMDRYPEAQLATLVDAAPEGNEWVHEIKLDGYRLLGYASDGAVRLRTRNGNDWTNKFPSLTAALENLDVSDAVLDMEAVIVDAKGKTNFQDLQAALGEGGHADKIVAFVFDLLHLDGKDLTTLPLTDRKQKLEALLKKSNSRALHYSAHIEGAGAEIFNQACAKGVEGIISKQANAPYKMGRQKSWLKVKCAQRQEFIILGFSDARTGDRALGALYLGYRKDGALKYAGKVGTGFSMHSARDLVERFEAIRVKDPVIARPEAKELTAGEWSSIHWVKPELLGEVEFSEWTNDGRIRHPSFQGLREDKDARDVKQEKAAPVKKSSKPVTKSSTKTDALVLNGIKITHPDRVISETGHVTKGELAEYYAAVAPFLVPLIARRPVSLLRCPSGIEGGCFYQRSPGRGLGADIHPFEFKHNGKKYEYIYIDDEKGLLEVAQMGAIEIHPWGATIDAIDYPDRMIFDLDPAPDVPFEALKLAAQDIRARLKKKGLESLLKTTGGKGLHVTVPLEGKDGWPIVKAFAASVAEEMVQAAPTAYVATMSKAKRAGKIFVDYFRNDYTATAIADYAVRARPGAPVAVPIEWKELDKLDDPSQFKMKDVLLRLQKKKPDQQSQLKAYRIPGA